VLQDRAHMPRLTAPFQASCSRPAIAGGMVFVNSGYARAGGMPGNVLLAFSVDGK
jgi:hypothetical protein